MMELSSGERLILVMMSEIYKHLKISGQIDPEFVLKSISSNQTWALRWEYDTLFHDSASNPPVVEETCKILDMYRTLTTSFAELSKKEQDRVEKETAPFTEYLKFRGFDGNNDAHYGVLAFFTDWPGKYDELGEHPLNSHSRGTLPHYKRMLDQYDPIIRSFAMSALTPEQIIQIVKS